MSKKSFIDSVEVKSPCTEDWSQMEGNERVRFCSHCSKSVNNLSEMTRKEAMRLVRASGGNLCIRYIANPVTKRPLFADQLLQITRRAPSVAAGVVSASLSLSTLSYAQGDMSARVISEPVASCPDKQKNDAPEKSFEQQNVKPEPTSRGRITGTVTDQNGAVIPFATVSINSISANKTATTNPDDSGVYRFHDLVPGRYLIEVEAQGFMASRREVEISYHNEVAADIQLGIGIEVTVDVVADVEMSNTVSGGAMISVDYSSPLAKAVADDDIDEVRDLVIKGANVNGKDENYDNITPLFIAVENGNIEITRLLLDFGAKVNVRDGEKQTPLMRLDSDATVELVELLMANGAKVNLADNEGNTALIIAADDASAEVVRALVKAGADVNLAKKDGETALMNAANRGDVESVKLLLEAGANVNAVDKDGDNAWVFSDNNETDELLIAFGVSVKERKRDQPRVEPVDN